MPFLPRGGPSYFGISVVSVSPRRIKRLYFCSYRINVNNRYSNTMFSSDWLKQIYKMSRLLLLRPHCSKHQCNWNWGRCCVLALKKALKQNRTCVRWCCSNRCSSHSHSVLSLIKVTGQAAKKRTNLLSRTELINPEPAEEEDSLCLAVCRRVHGNAP